MTWLREAISDEEGMADMAYIVIGGLAVSAIFALAFIFTMSALSYSLCYSITDVGQGVRAQVPCTFDPLPVGQAAGLVFGAFGALIGALAGYMAATRRNSTKTVTQSNTQQTTTTTSAADPIATVANPTPVVVIAKTPVPVKMTISRKRK